MPPKAAKRRAAPGGLPLAKAAKPASPEGVPLACSAPEEVAAMRQVADAMMSFDVPVAQIVKVASSGGVTRRACEAHLQQCSDMSTDYGKVSTPLDLQMTDGSVSTIYINNPFALLFAAASVSPKFGKFIAANVPQRAKIAFYTDETTPGNSNRPDHARSHEALLWTFVDLPTWFLDRQHGFFKFGFVLSQTVAGIHGGMPELVRQMLYKFFHPSQCNFETTGMRLPIGSDRVHITGRFGFFLVDEKAGKTNLSVKGAAGTKPCCCCKNVVGARTLPGDSDYLIHFTDHRRAKFDLHTPESFVEMKQTLDHVHLMNDAQELAETEQVCGINRDPLGLLWDPYLSAIINMPYCMYWDSMHCLWSSGGVGQLQVNGFILELLEHGISLGDLDSFSATVKGHTLRKRFFTDRVVTRKDAHIRAFATEVIDAVKVLVLFSDAVLAKTDKMPEHVRCLHLLNDIGDILRKQNDILLNVHRLDAMMEEHQEVYTRLYKSIPKNHLVRHVVDCILRHRKAMSCFAPERAHNTSKKITTHAYKHCSKTLLDRWNFKFFDALQHDETMFQEIHLVNPVPCPLFVQQLPPSTAVKASDQIMTQIGGVRKGDYVHIYDPQAGSPVLGRVVACLEVRPMLATESHFLLLCMPHQSLGDKHWAVKEPIVPMSVRSLLRRDCVRIDPLRPGVVQALL